MTINEQKRVACAVTFFHEKTCIQFVQRKASDRNFLTIKKSDERGGCFSSSLGMAGGEQVINLDQRIQHCWKHGTIVHEMMHVVGFFHEQARNDRDKYVRVHWNSVAKGWHKQYQKASTLGIEQKLVGDYDYEGVMHYSRYTPQSNRPTMTAKMRPVDRNNEVMGNRRAPTAMDATKINLLYGCEVKETHQDCILSEWQNVGKCTRACGGGMQKRNRRITQSPKGNGKVCPILTSTIKCNEHDCHADSTIMALGGYGSDSESSMEFYHTFKTFNHVHPVKMILQRRRHTSSLMDDGSVITVGGWYQQNRQVLSHCERVTPSTAEVSQCPSLLTAREHLGASVLDGFLHVCGGEDKTARFNSCEHLISNAWQESVPMNSKRARFSLVTLNGYLYAVGGFGAGDVHLSSVERRSSTDSTGSMCSR